jgi:hypothetical protein
MKFAEKTQQRIELASLVLAAGFALACLFYAGGYKLDGWIFWLISPYASFYIFSRFIQTPGPAAVKAGFIVALLMLLFTVVVYFSSIFVSTSSTSGIVFLFVPACLLVGAPVLLWVFN